MEPSEALNIIQALADGIDPNTGETFPPESPFQHPQVVRALLTGARALERQDQNEKRNRNLSTKAGTSWTEEEEKHLEQEFDAKVTIAELAQRHERTQGAILSRLEKLGKIQPSSHEPRRS